MFPQKICLKTFGIDECEEWSPLKCEEWSPLKSPFFITVVLAAHFNFTLWVSLSMKASKPLIGISVGWKLCFL